VTPFSEGLGMSLPSVALTNLG